jgi:ribosomal protein S6
MYDVNTIRGRCYAKYFTIKAQKEAIDKLVATFAIRGEVIRTKNVRSVIQQVERKTKLDYCDK